jgi:CLIP-associating protein 1/2
MNKTDGLQFRGFVPSLVACLEDPDGGVRETAKSCVVELFRYGFHLAVVTYQLSLISC